LVLFFCLGFAFELDSTLFFPKKQKNQTKKEKDLSRAGFEPAEKGGETEKLSRAGFEPAEKGGETLTARR
jgi:hypothetical protein